MKISSLMVNGSEYEIQDLELTGRVDELESKQPAVYTAGQTYVKGQLVSHNNVLYMVKVNSTNTEPSSDNADYRTVSSPIVQEMGTSESAVMSQKAISNVLGINKDAFTNLGYINNIGYYIQSENFRTTDFIPVKPGNKIIANIYSSKKDGVPAACFYDNNKQYVSTFASDQISDFRKFEIIIPDDVYYIRFNTRINYLDLTYVYGIIPYNLYNENHKTVNIIDELQNNQSRLLNAETYLMNGANLRDLNAYIRYNENLEGTDISSFTRLPKTYIFENEGDYIEFECRFYGSNSESYTYTLNILSLEDSISTRFGWQNKRFRLRYYNDYCDWNVGGVPYEWTKVYIHITSGGYELFINDISKGICTIPTEGGLKFNNICVNKSRNHDAFYQMYDIKYFKLHIGEDDFELQPQYYNGNNNTLIKFESTDNTQNNIITFNGSNRCKVYLKDQRNNGIYYMLNYSHVSNHDELIYQDLWEIDHLSKLCRYVKGNFIEICDLLGGGESEFVLHTAGSVDYTGGFHGDERIDIEPSCFIKLYIDGVLLSNNLTEEESFTKPFNEVSFIQKSTLHKTATWVFDYETDIIASGNGVLSLDTSNHHILIDGVDTGLLAINGQIYESTVSNLTLTKSGNNKWCISKVGIIDNSHEILGYHYKKTTISNNGYTTENYFEFIKENVTIDTWYHGICCLNKSAALIGHNEDFNNYQFTGDTNRALNSVGNRRFESYNPNTKLSAVIESELLTRISDDNNDDTAKMFIWDRVPDSKYYRAVSKNFIPEIGKKYRSIMKVKWNMLTENQ